ncbi:unnamed protein product [Gongylonema pulchrum]|uniref:Secreted protein n=1 Tax=Gongylonema pulchrum TaxID=637853 RepID=A0A183EZE6_9BILA|nr:unnamed protein product [Gongylonema pulchrum]
MFQSYEHLGPLCWICADPALVAKIQLHRLPPVGCCWWPYDRYHACTARLVPLLNFYEINIYAV